MPTYDYRCEKCGHEFEVFQSMKDDRLTDCPLDDCDGSVKRLIGTGAGIIFKGSGFYETDYRSDSYKAAAKADSGGGSAEGGSGGGGDSGGGESSGGDSGSGGKSDSGSSGGASGDSGAAKPASGSKASGETSSGSAKSG